MIKHILASPSYKCVKEPRCDFCYTRDKETESSWSWSHGLYNLAEKHPNLETVAFEYSGYKLRSITDGVMYFSDDWNYEGADNLDITITTMPEVITDTLLGYLKENISSLTGISLSFNEYTYKNWKQKGEKIKQHNLELACNYLLGVDMPPPDMEYDQLNILSRKPPDLGDPKSVKALLGMMHNFTAPEIEVTMDNYLAQYLGEGECKAGKEFIHYTPDGEVVPCSMPEVCPIAKPKFSKRKL